MSAVGSGLPADSAAAGSGDAVGAAAGGLDTVSAADDGRDAVTAADGRDALGAAAGVQGAASVAAAAPARGVAPAYRVDDRPVAEADFYAVACDPRRPAIVQACAGAGKTWMLVSRILLALLDGVEPPRILAITFTRKAAGEMRERLEDWLHDFAQPGCSHAERVAALRQRGLPAADAERLAPALQTLHARLLQGGRAVEFHTFHGWFSRLLGHAPLALLETLGLPARHELLLDMDELREPLFQRLHGAVERDAALSADYRLLVQRHRRHTLLQWLATAWRRGPELLRADAAGRVDGAVEAAALVWPDCAGHDDPAALLLLEPLRGQLLRLAALLGGSRNATPQRAGTALLDALALRPATAALAAAWQALCTDKGTPRRHLGHDAEVDAAVDALRGLRRRAGQQQAAEDHAALLRLARALLAEYAALKRQRGLVDMNDLERAAELLLGDSAMAGWVQERLDQRVRQVLIDEFQDTNPLQWQVLDGWLSSYAGAGGGGSGQAPPTVFIVGDPKQSIYRFRGAEPRVFDAAERLVVDGLGGQRLACDHTRRNAPAVLDALNAVFADAARVDGWTPFRPHTTAQATPGAVRRLPAIERAPVRPPALARDAWRDTLTEPRLEPEQRLRDAEAEGVAQAVRALIGHEGLAAGEIMVLARRRAMLADVAQALARHGLPHAVAEPLALHESPEALDLVAVLDVLASPGHDLALARALKSPLFGAADDDLLALSQAAAAAARPWLPTLLAAVPGADDADERLLARAPLQRARRLFAAWSAVALHTAPHDLLDRVVGDADAVPRIAAAVPPARRAAALQAVDALLAASLAKGGGRFSTVYGFVRELRAGRLRTALAAPADAVQLLTVHGAKGLEARAVIVVDSDPQPRAGERGLVLVEWPVERAHPDRVAFVHSEPRVPESLRAAWAVDAEAVLREELNGLYVAMTRAREWLVFSATAPRRSTPGVRSWWTRVHDEAEAWDPATPAGERSSAADRVGASVAGLHDDADRAASADDRGGRAAGQAGRDRTAALAAAARVPVLPPFTGTPADAPAAAFAPLLVAGEGPGRRDTPVQRLGRAVHRALEWATQPGAARAGRDPRGDAREAALAMGLTVDEAPRIAALVAAVLGSADSARFFAGPALRWAGNEVPVAVDGRPQRIDRLVALADTADGPWGWWVLDYKLQADPTAVPAYREQLGAYVRAVRALQPGERVRGAFVTGGGRVVEVDVA